jgi:hypothetical protein
MRFRRYYKWLTKGKLGSLEADSFFFFARGPVLSPPKENTPNRELKDVSLLQSSNMQTFFFIIP